MTRLMLKGAALVLAALVLHLVLIQPNHPAAMTWQALFLFPLELPFIVLLLLALPERSRWTAAVRLLLVVFLVVIAVLKVADYALFIAFSRTFNPLVDLNLVEAGVRLLAGTIGQVQTALVVLAGVIAPFILGALLWWATSVWASIPVPPPVRGAATFASVLALGVAVAEIGDARGYWRLPVEPPGAAFTGRVALERATAYNRLFRQLRAFRTAAAEDAYAATPGIFDRLEGRDVVIVFIESYGRTSLDNPLYAPTHGATLAAAEDKLAGAGLAVRSGWLTSPISGGQSWLAHGTFASGLRTANQALYTAMLASQRKTLYHLADESGYESMAIVPAITLPWPEAKLLGFETVYNAEALGYQGEPFNWVTMPDQYTLSAFDRLRAQRENPVFAEIALISSHAPWVPIPDLIDWSDVGDGTVFNAMATSGDPASVVWRDRDRVRAQYRKAIDYSLETVFDYAARSPESRDRVMVVLGDHAPAKFVSQIESFEVPIHLIGSPDVIADIADWNWSAGLIPDPDQPAWPMADFRDRFIDAFTSAEPAVEG